MQNNSKKKLVGALRLGACLAVLVALVPTTALAADAVSDSPVLHHSILLPDGSSYEYYFDTNENTHVSPRIAVANVLWCPPNPSDTNRCRPAEGSMSTGGPGMLDIFARTLGSVGQNAVQPAGDVRTIIQMAPVGH